MEPIATRFWKHVKKTDQCWEWIGAVTRKKKGYGRINENGKMRVAHRVAYELCIGPIPEGMRVLHSCDNSRCVNPDHLFLGTQQDNMIDCSKKDRLNSKRGEGHHAAKLTREDVQKLRLLYPTGRYTQVQLAKMFGVTRENIQLILYRKAWDR